MHATDVRKYTCRDIFRWKLADVNLYSKVRVNVCMYNSDAVEIELWWWDAKE